MIRIIGGETSSKKTNQNVFFRLKKQIVVPRQQWLNPFLATDLGEL